jgi:class 3 adenylate cyclase
VTRVLQRESPQQRKNETGERHPGRLGCHARQDHRDGILATFDGPGRAIRCAAALRDELAGIGLAIRAGLHIGEIELRDGDVGGKAVQLFAARRRRGLGRITP